MKLIFAIVQNDDSKRLVKALVQHNISVTRISTTGGFLHGGNTTLMIGVEDDRVEKVMEILKDNCAKRTETVIVMPHGTGGTPAWGVGCTPMKVEVGGATLFIIEVAEFKKL